MPSANDDLVKQALTDKVWRWVDKVIVAEQFCPFAKVPRENDTIHLSITSHTQADELLADIAHACKHLDENKQVETTLLACSHALSDLHDYLDLLDAANRLLEDIGYYGIYQLASFHPYYLFEGEDKDSVSHYTNRSPLPIFHLIREASITRALQFVDDPESIPERNIEHAQALGKDFFKQYL